MQIEDVKRFLKEYDGPDITLMEVCGSHTAAIAKYGLKHLLSERIHLVSGPGCPVCVTPSSYIDRLIELAKTPNTCVVTFGDLLRVPGSHQCLNEAKGEGAQVKMVYSPADTLKLAAENPAITYVFAAVGFETTTPVYALLLEQIESRHLTNIKLLTALKTMPAAIEWICENGAKINGFLAPGHVCAITGSDAFLSLAKIYQIPFGVAGFLPEELLLAIYGLIKMIENPATVKNFYPSVVTPTGNRIAQEKTAVYFETSNAVWRGMGEIKNSGLLLKDCYAHYDAGSGLLVTDNKINKACCCDRILIGKLTPNQCPLFKKECTPYSPQGACMVSTEGSCYQYYQNEL